MSGSSGFGLPTDRIHAPNERLYVPSLFRGIEACIELYYQLARELIAIQAVSSGQSMPLSHSHRRSSGGMS